jgi:uncharacterized protein (TIGR00251 family)
MDSPPSAGKNTQEPGFRLTPGRGGTVFRVRVSPGASRDRISGLYGGALKVSVTAPPEKGKANAGLIKFLAKAMGVDKNRLQMLSGETGRDKRLLLQDADAAETQRLLKRTAGL